MNHKKFRNKFFPSLDTNTYLASCSLGAYSTILGKSFNNIFFEMTANSLAWGKFEKEILLLRRDIAQYINAETEQIALVSSATMGAFQVASTINWGSGNEMIYCSEEFPSIVSIWLTQKERGATPILIETDAKNLVEEYIKNINASTQLVSIPFSCYSDGKNIPINKILEKRSESNFKLFIDAYQAIGSQPIDVRLLKCDFLIGGFMKYMLGLPGVAFLYIKDYKKIELNPSFTGWFGRENPFDYDYKSLTFAAGARRFESGTPSIPSVYTARAGLNLLQTLNIEEIRYYIKYLISYAYMKLCSINETVLNFTNIESHGSHLTIIELDIKKLVLYLETKNIIVSPTQKGIRISFHYYNNIEDIDKFILSLKSFRVGNLR
jgi:selenocysteine lyase/cysteine desulfurase